jgi:putative transcriptional regulator
MARKKQRNIGEEILEGLHAIKAHYEGKMTLRTYTIEERPLPPVDAQLIRDTRERLKVSRRVFARQLRINERTLEKWEQGRAKPNKQAATLILLTRKFPDTLKRLAQLAA